MRAIRSHAEPHRPDEILLTPATDSGPRMRRDVRAKESTERGRERAPAGVGLRVLPRLGVAADAAAHLRYVQATLRVLCERVSCDGDQRQRAVQNK
jgi:hypothetical protein